MDEVDALAPPPDDPLIPLPSSVLWFLLTTVEAGQRTILPAHDPEFEEALGRVALT